MAETDGTPRFPKSKTPKGANGSGASTNRNTRPNGKSRKRAALRDTLQTGVSADEPQPVVTPPTDAASAIDHSQDTSVVKTTMPTVIRADVSSDALADTYADMRAPIARSTAPMPKRPLGPRGARGALGSTLRMELTVQKNEGSEPRIQVRPTGQLNHAELFDTDQNSMDAPDGSSELRDGLNTLQQGPKRSRKPTQPGFAPAFPDPSARPLRGGHGTLNGAAAAADQRILEHTQRRGSDIDPGSLPPRGSAPSMSTTGNRPRRPRRPGERTLIMTARKKSGSKRDWVFVVLLVAALGLTASMFLSQQSPAEEVVDAAAYEDDPQAQPDEQDPFAQTTLRPWKGQAADQKQSDTNALTAHEPSPAANTIQATELRTQPSGAEVLAGDAVVGSTPVRVARGSTDMVYVLRLAGHESKVVRVGPHSPASILVELGRLVPPDLPADAPAAAPAATSGN
ncbi:MAG TPA: hypothetical protein VFN67_42860 [Polyangiales bacterium]|nr:hypothetical protein [Polyangiales bacterium]